MFCRSHNISIIYLTKRSRHYLVTTSIMTRRISSLHIIWRVRYHEHYLFGFNLPKRSNLLWMHIIQCSFECVVYGILEAPQMQTKFQLLCRISIRARNVRNKKWFFMACIDCFIRVYWWTRDALKITKSFRIEQAVVFSRAYLNQAVNRMLVQFSPSD